MAGDAEQDQATKSTYKRSQVQEGKKEQEKLKAHCGERATTSVTGGYASLLQ